MKFLYPEFNTVTHIVTSTIGTSLEYPANKSFATSNAFLNANIDLETPEIIQSGSQIIVVRENIGYNCEWSYVRSVAPEQINDENLDPLQFYILNSNLSNIGGKQTYNPICSIDNAIQPSAEEIVPFLKEVFVPYIDKKNGLYSVRISVDYEKILDMKLFNRVIQEVYLEGVNLLLASRGFLSDNKTILELKDKYYTFAYIHKDFDLTVRRACEPLTFTVSIPLNFFNNSLSISDGSTSKKAINFITFTNLNFVNKIDNIIDILTNRIDDLNKALFPNKILENFVIDFELNSLKKFAIATNEIMQIANYSFNSTNNLIEYLIGLDKDLNVVSVNIKTFDDDKEITYTFPEQLLVQIRLRGDFNNKRIFNYFFRLEDMLADLISSEIIEFYKRYVTYPNIRVIGETATINGVTFSPEQIKEFRLNMSKNSESCIKLSDFQKLYNSSTETAQIFSDPLFHLFTANDPANNTQQADITKDLKDSRDNTEKTTDESIKQDKPLKFIHHDFMSELDILGSTLKNTLQEDYLRDDDRGSTINSLGYILKRINIQEVILKQIICYLKGLNQSDPELARILAQMPNQVLNYIAYMETLINGDLKGAAWLRAVEQGITFDFELFCSDEFAYFLKGITGLINTINIGANTAITIIKEIDATFAASGTGNEYRAVNPYGAIIQSVAKQIYITIFDIIYDSINTILTPVCDDPLYDESADNFADPYNTHIPITVGNSRDNQDNSVIKNNRLNAVKETFPEIFRELQYGVDLEYTVDLLQLLINDIKCLLTPTENINLLKGKPSEEVIVLIKNIIRNKYSKDPNNLSYLLSEDKLKLFFKKLGYTVDQEKLEATIDVVSKITPANVCTPEQYQVRCELINNKLPKELGILQDDLKNRTQKIRSLLDKVRSGGTIINISALCPDIEDDNIRDLKGDLAKQYSDSIKSIFTNVLNTFSKESSKVADKMAEERTLFRKKDNVIIDQYKYFTYYSTLSKNLDNVGFDNTSEEYKTNESFIIKFQQADEKMLEEWQYQDLFFDTSYLKAEIPKECGKPASYKSDERFKKFLSEGRVLWENRPWSRKWDNIGKKWKDRGSKSTWASQFVQELYEQSPELYEYIKQKKYILLISSETSGQYNPSILEDEMSRETYQKLLYKSLIHGENDEKIVFRFLYYTKPEGVEDNKVLELGDFRLLYEAEINVINEWTESEVKKINKDIRITLGNYTGEVLSNLQYDKRGEEKFENMSPLEFYSKYYPQILKFFRVADVPDNMRYGTHVLDADFIKLADKPTSEDGFSFEFKSGIYAPIGYSNQDTVLNIIQEIFTKNFESSVGSIETFEKLYNSRNKFLNKGLFNITNKQNSGANECVRMIMLPTSTGIEDNPLDYRIFYTVTHKQEPYPTSILNSVKFERFYKSLYKAIDNYYLDDYFKKTLSEKELLFLKKDGTYEQYDWTNSIRGQSELDAYYEDLANSDFALVKNKDYSDKQANNAVKINSFDLSTDIRYRNCNVFPHYLNLDYLLMNLEDSYKQLLCDSNITEIPEDLLKETIAITTIRSYVTDLMIKIIPFLSLLDNSELNNFHRDIFVIDVIREHIKKEMFIFNSAYFDDFIKMVNTLYAKEDFAKKLKQELFLETSSDKHKILEYFISKEIKRFIKFCIEKSIFIAQPVSIYKDKKTFETRMASAGYNLVGSNTDSQEVVNTLRLFTPTQIKNEFYTFMIYLLMYNTIDTNKRSIFVGTKQELASIFFSNVNRQSSSAVYEERPQEDIVKFINNLSKTADPALMVYLNPSYSRYIEFAIGAIRAQAKQSLLLNAVYTEPNIALTRVVNYSLTAASIMAWSLIDQKERDALMLRASVDNVSLSLLYDRINNGKGPIPQQILSLAASAVGAGIPGLYGIPYLGLDVLDEYDWFNTAMKNIENLRNQALNGQDPCEVTDINTDLLCEDNIDRLLEEINKFEE